jgi:uncharacterized protein
MGFRTILVALAIIAVVLIVRHLARQSGTSRAPSGKASVAMVRCAYCGLHLPRSEALGSDERFFCSKDHREASRSAGH